MPKAPIHSTHSRSPEHFNISLNPAIRFFRLNSSNSFFVSSPGKNPTSKSPAAENMSTSSALPAPRLVVTTHTRDGTSVFESDNTVTPFKPFGPAGSGFARFHSRLSVPVSNTSSPPDLSQTLPRCPPEGVMFCTTDIMPGGRAPMHRTVSCDYVAVMAGEIVLRLDGGEEKVLRAGDYVVGRGVNHEWINRSEEVCRMMVVMVGAEKVRLENGRVLEETVFKK